MRKTILLVCTIVVCSLHLHAQSVWSSSGGAITFTKVGFADWTQAANQDRISDSVWITRTNSQGIFNIKKESAYQTGSPIGTEWALGTTASYSTLTYKSFIALSNSNPSTLIGKDLVLHLISENIYLDIKFSAYGSGSTGAQFAYTRASGSVGVAMINSEKIETFTLLQNYPNPFNPTTTIKYDIPNVGTQYIVSLRVYDILGKEVATLVNETKTAGTHSIQFDAAKLPSGIYFARMQYGNTIQMKKMILLK